MVIEAQEMDTREGFELRVELHYDQDASPHDADCYGAEDIEAYQWGDWEFVGVVVVASRAGVDLASGSIWGVERGQLAGVTADPYYAVEAYDLAGEAIAEARKAVHAICAEVVPA